MNRKTLKQTYESSCNNYLRLFLEKHGYEYDPNLWVGGSVGTITEVSDLFVGMEDIRIDIDQNVPEEEFIKWYDYSLRLHSLGCSGVPNYSSWLRRCPIKTEEEILEMEAAKKRIDDLTEEFENKYLK